MFVLYLRDVSVRHDASLLLRGGALIGGVCGYRGAHHPAPVKLYNQSALSPNPDPDPEYNQSTVIQLYATLHCWF